MTGQRFPRRNLVPWTDAHFLTCYGSADLAVTEDGIPITSVLRRLENDLGRLPAECTPQHLCWCGPWPRVSTQVGRTSSDRRLDMAMDMVAERMNGEGGPW